MGIKASRWAFIISVLFILFSVGAVSSQVPQGQGWGTANNQVLADLLAEVRRLRTAVESDHRDSYSGLMLVERIRLQQEHVDRLATQLDDIRLDLASSKTLLPQMQERVKVFESQVKKEYDVVQLSQLELELSALRSTVEQQVSRQQIQQERESQLATQLQAEQSKLNELNDKLQMIEASLEK
jgi:chromosome segregation ATPase